MGAKIGELARLSGSCSASKLAGGEAIFAHCHFCK